VTNHEVQTQKEENVDEGSVVLTIASVISSLKTA